MTHSLRGRLLAWVVLPLSGAVLVDGWISHQNARANASVVQDRLLLGSARVVGEQIRVEDDALQANVPPAALELFQSSDVDRVYYRVIGADGHTVTGYPELKLPKAVLQPEAALFYDVVVRGQPVRAVAYLQPVLTDTGIQPVLVEVAQTLQGRGQLTRTLWLQAMVQQLITLVLVALLVLIGLRKGLQPLLRLRDAVLARRPGTLQPLEIAAMPVELTPLIEAVNDYVRRLEHHNSVQQQFIQNAAHQLRTPLTLLTTQVSYAVRATDGSGRTESLTAIRRTVQQSVRLVNQLLMLSAAEAHGEVDATERPTSLGDVVRQVVEDVAGRAQIKAIDLGFETAADAALVAGHAVTLREIAMNLVDNAIRYTQAGGVVTTRIGVCDTTVTLTVEDNGPGIAPDLRARAFERFYRIHDAESDGCGLGLAIVQEFASRMGARVGLRTADSGQGLAVDVIFARAPSDRPLTPRP